MHWTESTWIRPLFVGTARAEPGLVPLAPHLVARRLRRNWRQRIGGNHNSRTRLQLELANGHDTVTRLQTFEDFRTSLDAVAGLHEGSHRRQAGLAVVFLLLGDEIDGIAIQC